MEYIGGCFRSHQIKMKHDIERNDYISFLPNTVMFHIFSLLPLEAIILASLVSKQWEILVKTYFSIVPSSLILDELEMTIMMVCKHNKIHPCELTNFPIIYQEPLLKAVITGTRNFNQFVNRALHLHTGCTMDKLCFKLCYDGVQDSLRKVDQWFIFSMTHEVKELEINLSGGKSIEMSDKSMSYQFPLVKYTSKSLESVKLNHCRLAISNFDAFGSLQSLFLKHVMVVGFSIDDLITKCPMMKKLTIDCCFVPLDFLISKRDIMIESLKIISGLFCQIDISAPELLTFTLENFFLTSETNIKAPNLIDVDITIKQPHAWDTHQSALVKLMDNFHHCQSISLNTWCIQVLSHGAHILHQSWNPFNNLKHLTLKIGFEGEEFPGISFMMRLCPYIESLILFVYDIEIIDWGDFGEENPIIFEFDENDYWQPQASAFPCLKCCLKEVTVYGISGCNFEMQMFEFLLNHAEVLEKMSVHTIEGISSIEIYNQLINYEKASPQVAIFMDYL